MSQNPTENLRCGRRRIEEIPEIILLKDWTWDVVTNVFIFTLGFVWTMMAKIFPE